MISKLQYALLLSLASSTALASVHPTSMPVTHSAGRIDSYKGLKEVKTSKVKVLKTNIPSAAPTMQQFKPFVLKRVTIEFNGDNANMEAISKEYVGQKITPELLRELNVKLTKSLIKSDYLLPKIHVDHSAMKSGVLHLAIMPANIDRVVIVGENNNLIKEYADKIVQNKPAMVSTTQRYLALMDKIPGYDVTYQLKQNQDSLDLVVYTTKKKWSAFMGVDSYGLTELGQYHASALAQAYSPFGGSEALLVHGSTTNHPDRLSDFGLGYSQAINAEGTSVHLFASHSEDNPTKKKEVSTKNNKANSFKMALTHHLFLKAHEDLEAEAGFAYKDKSSYQVQNNQSVSAKTSRYWIGDAGLKYLVKDGIDGRNLFTIAYIQGLGGTFKNYLTDKVTNKDFSIGRFNFYREQPLQYNFSIFSHIAASYSGDNLPDSEKSLLGGRDFGRGYDFGTLDGSKLFAVALEARYTKKMQEDMFIEHVQPYLFYDYGHVGKQAANTNISSLQSAGLGLRFKFDYGIEMGTEAAFPFKQKFVIDGDSYKAKTKYSFFLNKVFEF
jgi:hemolysin activation/secretion protein